MKRSLTALLALIFLTALIPQAARAATVLEVGSTGTNVVKVQQKLISWGYLKGSADGRYGAATRDAVKWFQKNNGLAVDGKVGPSTAAKMGFSSSSSSSSTSTASSSATIISADHRLLSKLVYAEARGETYKGQVAVAAVVLNRVQSSHFPNTVSGVVYQAGAFSCVSNGSINNSANSSCIRAALDALNGWDPSGGALYYYNPRGTNDQWIRTRTVVAVIGSHYFAV
jgi:N-acetylmuramoyl-L-alanine amidase